MLKTFSVNVLLSDDASVAEATGAVHPYGVGEVRGKGSAKRHPKDSPDELVGYSLAVARALRDLADQYEQRAEQAQAPATSPEYASKGLFFDGTTSWTMNPNGTLTVRK